MLLTQFGTELPANLVRLEPVSSRLQFYFRGNVILCIRDKPPILATFINAATQRLSLLKKWPVSTAKIAETGKRIHVLECVVADAVLVEPVSTP